MAEQEKKNLISRREFLKDAGIVVGGAAVTTLVACTSSSTGETTGTTEPTSGSSAGFATESVAVINVKINGSDYKLSFGDDVEPWDVNAYDVYPWDTLMYTLREKLGLTGTKPWCEHGACGACTVIVDGKPTLSCLTLTASLDGKEVTTIEGLGTPDNLHPIQEAFIENNASQCGFCTPGMIMATKALLDRNPNPTVDEIKWGLGNNLCRCSNYTFYIKAVQSAAQKL